MDRDEPNGGDFPAYERESRGRGQAFAIQRGTNDKSINPVVIVAIVAILAVNVV